MPPLCFPNDQIGLGSDALFLFSHRSPVNDGALPASTGHVSTLLFLQSQRLFHLNFQSFLPPSMFLPPWIPNLRSPPEIRSLPLYMLGMRPIWTLLFIVKLCLVRLSLRVARTSSGVVAGHSRPSLSVLSPAPL